MYHLCDLTKPSSIVTPDHTGRYSIIVADPPWWYADQKKVRKDGKTPTRGIGACHHYDQMKTPEIAGLTFPGIVANAANCHLYMWATCPLFPDALDVMRAWGFRWATVAFVWIKTNGKRWEEAADMILQARMWPYGDAEIRAFLERLAFFGPGYYTGSNVELVLLGIKGKPFYHAAGRKASQLIFAPLDEEHSRKPEEMQSRIEYMYPFIPKAEMCELFARRERRGWDCYGNENIFPPYPEEGV